MAGIPEDRGRRERVWFVCGRAPKREGDAAVDLQHISPINLSAQSRCQGGRGVEKTTTRKSPNREREFTAKDRHLYGSSTDTMHKRRSTHGGSGECSISTKRSRSRAIVKSRIVIPESICAHAVELLYRFGAGNGGDSFET